MSHYNFRFAYIDAFAGTGYRTIKKDENQEELPFPDLQPFLDGSARIALQITPCFTKYIFIEQSESRFAELQKLKEEFPQLQNDIEDWYDVFYRTISKPTLFGDEVITQKVGDFDLIGQYFVKRLETVFAGVAPNPLPLFNSHNNPLYLLCFASGNPKGAKTAINIAQDILRR